MSQTNEIGVYTFYAHIGHRGAKIPIPPVLIHFPHDWAELKEHLLDRAIKAFENYGTIEALWTLEKHTSSKVKVWRQTTRSYTLKPFYWARNVLAYFVVAYNYTSNTITVKQASFSPIAQTLAREYRETEKGVKYEIKPIIPKNFKSFIEDPKAVIRELSALRYPDYFKTPKLKYDRQARTLHTTLGSYVPFGQKLRISH